MDRLNQKDQRANPRLGVIADSTLQRHNLCKIIESTGYEVGISLSPERVDTGQIYDASIDLWWVEIEDEDKWADFVSLIYEKASCPILIGDGYSPPSTSPKYPRWERRIYTKIVDIVGKPVMPEEPVTLASFVNKSTSHTPLTLPPELHEVKHDGVAAKNIWVIGASLGGPAAVKEFIDALPEGLPVAFIIAQHIDVGFQQVLAQVWGRHSHFSFVDAIEGQVISHGQVVIAPVEKVMTVNANSQIQLHRGEWEGPYSPSIDLVMNSSVDALGCRTGAILFSGMGNDGAIAGPKMHELGVEVWAQTADTCANSSMPDSARATGCVTYSASPRGLAEYFVGHMKILQSKVRSPRSTKPRSAE